MSGTRRPSLTRKRIAALEAIAAYMRPKLQSRAAEGLFVLPREERRAMRPALDFLDGLKSWAKDRDATSHRTEEANP